MRKETKNEQHFKMKKKLKLIVDNMDYEKMVGFDNYPIPGEYYITGPQAGNSDLTRYVGYVVQVRLKAGAFGSNCIFMRHPDGVLMTHENQSFFAVDGYWENKIIELFDDETTPALEDYSKAYTIRDEYPEIGKIIEPKECDRSLDESPLAQITITHSDGSKTVEVC